MPKTTVSLSLIRPNRDNPRVIRDEKFKQLCANLRKYPKFLEKRPIIIESWAQPTVLGGNQRLEGLKAIGYTEIPREWIKTAEDFTEEEMKAFIILDNLPFGEWDFDALSQHFDFEQLKELGLDIPDFSALAAIDMDEFFGSGENAASALAEKYTIVLEYPVEEGKQVSDALAQINPSPERAVRQLLGLEKR